MIEVLTPGLLTTVQDLGRFGFGDVGVSPGGAADGLALRVANLLVGNPPGAAGLEITLRGPRLRFDAPAVIALAGADLGARLDGAAVPLHHRLRVAPGAELSFTGAAAAVRGYLAIAGGVAVPTVLGGASTDLRGGFGGLDGRALRAGDRLETGAAAPLAGAVLGAPPPALLERGSVLRVLPGVHVELFGEASRQLLFASEFEVRSDSDRMGVRLVGRQLGLLAPRELLSEGVAPGAVQVPAGGAPIVLGVDHPSTGGYPQIAHVIAADLPALAQLRPHQRIRFAPVDLAAARAALQTQETTLHGWGQVLK